MIPAIILTNNGEKLGLHVQPIELFLLSGFMLCVHVLMVMRHKRVWQAL